MPPDVDDVVAAPPEPVGSESSPHASTHETGVIANTKKVQALVRAYGRASSVANYDEFAYGRHAE